MQTPASQRLRTIAVILTALVAMGLYARVRHVHEQTWEWRLRASDSPPKVQWDGRDYRRGAEVAAPAAGSVEAGHVLGDLPVYSSLTKGGSHAATGIYLHSNGRWVEYSLMGGP